MPSKTALLKNRKSHAKAKPIVGKLVWRKKLPSAGKNNEARKSGKSKRFVIKENKPKPLINLLPKTLVKLVIDYFADNLYSLIVSTHKCLFQKELLEIAVDSARVYLIPRSGGITGLSHFLVNTESSCIELGDPQWFDYWWAGSSHDGQYICVSYLHKKLINREMQTKRATKWFTQSNESEDRRPKPVAFDDENLAHGFLSRDGQTLCANNYRDSTTRVCQIKEHGEKNPTAFTKFEFKGAARAVSGKGNRVIVKSEDWLAIHDICKDTSKLICQFDVTGFGHICALNEDGGEAAFVSYNGYELRIVEADKVFSLKADQPVIVTVKVPESVGLIHKLVYADGGKLHVLSSEGVSLFNTLTKEFIFLEAPREGQKDIDWAISSNADYIVVLKKNDVMDQRFTHTMIVKRKLGSTDWKNLFGYEADVHKQAAKP